MDISSHIVSFKSIAQPSNQYCRIVYLRIKTGKIKKFGNYKIITKSSNIHVIENKIPWTKGDLYSKEKTQSGHIDEIMKLKFLKSPIIIPEPKERRYN